MAIRIKGVGATTVITDDCAPIAVITMNNQRGWPHALHWNDPRTGGPAAPCPPAWTKRLRSCAKTAPSRSNHMQLNYYHEVAQVVAEAIDQVIEDRENTEDAYNALVDVEHQVQGWVMIEEESRMPLLHLIRSTKVLIEENL